MISRKGEISTANYDHLGRKTSLSIPNMGVYSYEYNIMGQAVKVSHGSEAIRYIYDDLGRVVRETDGAGRHMDYAYNDAAGTWDIKYNVTNSSHYWLRYATDDAGRLSSIKEYGTNTLATYRYDTLSRVKSVAFGNGTVKNVTYEASGHLKSLKHNFTGTADDATWLYGRNNNGQVTSKNISNAGYQWTPSFTSNTLYSANALNQYYNIGGIKQKHDKNGNLIQDGSMNFVFNALGQMTEAKSGGMIVGKYEYDPLGRRKAKTAGGLKTEYLWGGNQVMAEYRSGRLLRRYIYGAGIDNPIALISGNGTKTYIHKDALGSVVALSNNAGVVTDKFSYSPFGKSADESGSPYKFAARRIDSETGLYYNRNRYYNPSTGRFISPDPIGYGDGMNMYAYVGNDPMNATDPMGLFANDDDDVMEEIIVIGQRIKRIGSDFIVTISGDAVREWLEQFSREYMELFLNYEKKKVLNYGKDNCSSNSFKLTDKQKKLAAAGKRKEFWKSRLKNNDPIAKHGLNSASPSPKGFLQYFGDKIWGGQAINRRLTSAWNTQHNAHLNNPVNLNAIGVKLMQAHVSAINTDNLGIPGVLNARQVAKYHHKVFAEYSLPPTTFGGTPITGRVGEVSMTAFVWFKGCKD